LADHDLRFDIVLAVRRLEPAIEFRLVREFGLAAAADQEILRFAAREGFIVVSHDVGTMKGHAERQIATGEPMLGLFLVPQDRLTRATSESLHLIWATSDAEEWNGTIDFLPL
jgi:predicted nuclease of predicted toxin-antitoxin system